MGAQIRKAQAALRAARRAFAAQPAVPLTVDLVDGVLASAAIPGIRPGHGPHSLPTTWPRFELVTGCDHPRRTLSTAHEDLTTEPVNRSLLLWRSVDDALRSE
jgi:hypothetical protein